MILLHDRTGHRLGEITTAYAVRRNYLRRASGRIPEAEVRFSTSDTSIVHSDARRGNVIVIQSEDYPHPWVGYIAKRSGTRDEIILECVGWEQVLRHRVLPDRMFINAGAGVAFLAILDTVNATNPTGIARGLIQNHGPLLSGRYHSWDALKALDDIAERTGYEWKLEYTVSRAEVLIEARFGESLGEDHTDSTILVADGEHCDYEQWQEDSEARLYRAVVIGAMASPTTPLSSRAHAQRIRPSGSGFVPFLAAASPPPGEDEADLSGLYGDLTFASSGSGSGTLSASSLSSSGVQLGATFKFEPFIGGQSPARRHEAVRISDTLLSEDSVSTAVDAELRQGRYSERTATLRVYDRSLWPNLAVGNAVRLVAAAPMFELGIDQPVRIQGVEALEEDGYLRIAVEVMQR